MPVGNAAYDPMVVDSEEHDPTLRVRESDELGREALGVRRRHGVALHTHLLEFDARVVANPKLIEDLFLGIKHGSPEAQ